MHAYPYDMKINDNFDFRNDCRESTMKYLLAVTILVFLQIGKNIVASLVPPN